MKKNISAWLFVCLIFIPILYLSKGSPLGVMMALGLASFCWWFGRLIKKFTVGLFVSLVFGTVCSIVFQGGAGTFMVSWVYGVMMFFVGHYWQQERALNILGFAVGSGMYMISILFYKDLVLLGLAGVFCLSGIFYLAVTSGAHNHLQKRQTVLASFVFIGLTILVTGVWFLVPTILRWIGSVVQIILGWFQGLMGNRDFESDLKYPGGGGSLDGELFPGGTSVQVMSVLEIVFVSAFVIAILFLFGVFLFTISKLVGKLIAYYKARGRQQRENKDIGDGIVDRNSKLPMDLLNRKKRQVRLKISHFDRLTDNRTKVRLAYRALQMRLGLRGLMSTPLENADTLSGSKKQLAMDYCVARYDRVDLSEEAAVNARVVFLESIGKKEIMD